MAGFQETSALLRSIPIHTRMLPTPFESHGVQSSCHIEVPTRLEDETQFLDETDAEGLIKLAPAPRLGILQVGSVTLLIAALLLCSRYITRAELEAWVSWISKGGTTRGAFYVAVYGVCLVLMLPASVLSLCAGALFGLYQGSLIVWLGNIVGQTAAFLLARFLFRDIVRHQLEKRWPKFYLIDSAVQREGWKIVVILRLSPIVPFTVTNYVLGVTKLAFWTYTWSSALSVMPFVVVSVYVGCLSKNTFDILDGNWGSNQNAIVPWGIMSAICMAGMLFFAYRFAKKAMQETLLQAVTPSMALQSQALPATPNSLAVPARFDRVGFVVER